MDGIHLLPEFLRLRQILIGPVLVDMRLCADDESDYRQSRSGHKAAKHGGAARDAQPPGGQRSASQKRQGCIGGRGAVEGGNGGPRRRRAKGHGASIGAEGRDGSQCGAAGDTSQQRRRYGPHCMQLLQRLPVDSEVLQFPQPGGVLQLYVVKLLKGLDKRRHAVIQNPDLLPAQIRNGFAAALPARVAKGGGLFRNGPRLLVGFRRVFLIKSRFHGFPHPDNGRTCANTD